MDLDLVEQLTLDVVRLHPEGLLPSELRTHVHQQHGTHKRAIRGAIARLWYKGYVNLGHDLRIRAVIL